MITCKTIWTLHADAEDGRLGPIDAARYALHMKVCPGCRGYGEQLAKTRDALADLPQETAPSDVKRAALAALRKKSP